MAQIGTVVVHYAWGKGERGIRTEGGGSRTGIRSTSTSRTQEMTFAGHGSTRDGKTM
jgi:hypothetical protein